MADWYVWSGATGDGTGVDWDNAFIALETAVDGKAAGDVFWVAHDHVQTAAVAVAIAGTGTNALPQKAYCVDRLGSVPPVSADLRTTAQINTTLDGALTVTGNWAEINGINFSAGSGASSADISLGTTGQIAVLRNCLLKLNNTATTSRIVLALGVGSMAILDNVAMHFGNGSQRAVTGGRVIWYNTPTSAILGTVPTLGLLANAANGSWHVEGVDLSGLGANELADGSACAATITVKDCKLGGGPIMGAPQAAYGAQEVYIIRSDNGDRNYRNEKHTYSCVQTTETAIVRVGGASDGTTPVAWKFVTSASACKELAFLSMPIVFWNESAGAPRIVTIQGLWNGPAAPLNDEIWLDVSYLGMLGFPLARFTTTKPADHLATDAISYPPGEVTWTGGVMIAFAMTATIEPMEKGPVTIYVRVGKPSSTFYIDPRPVVT